MSSEAQTSWASSEGVRRSMKANRGRDTTPELALRSALHRDGLRFRKHRRPVANLRCTADVVFPTERIAVFVDGCFWHRCPDHATTPKTNHDWWAQKFDGNVARDRRNDAQLGEAGWEVIRVWEHEHIADAVARIRTGVDRRRRDRAA